MTAERPAAVPNPEWVLMYQAGLSRGRIAELTGTSPSTVGYHLRAARAADPGLHAAHERAAAPKTTRVTYQGLGRMKELIAAVQETGRYPSQNASDLSERTLAAWLKRRRSEAHAGTLAPAYREGLSILNGWEGIPRLPRQVAEQADSPGQVPCSQPRSYSPCSCNPARCLT